MARPKVDHANTKCNICGRSETGVGKLDWRRDKYREGGWDGKSYLCINCEGKERQKMPNSQNNARKAIANIRTGNLRVDTKTGRSVIDQAVVIKVRGAKDVNVEMDNFDYFVDIIDEQYGKVDVKGAILISQEYIGLKGKSVYNKWSFHTHNKIDCDTYICLGYSQNRKDIEIVLIIPNDGLICNIAKIRIYKTTFGTYKYGEFKVDPKPYNDAYHDLMEFLKHMKSFGIEDIKKWLTK